jgi:chromosome segregation protein
MAEIEPRLKTLERQARRAKEYAAAQADLREVLREWYGYHWHHAQEELQTARDNVLSHQGKAEQAHESLARSQSEHGRIRARLTELRTQITEWHRQASGLHGEREAVSLALAVLDERRRTMTATIVDLTAGKQSVTGENLLAADRLQELEGELKRTEQEAQEATIQLQAAQATLQARQSGRGALEIGLQSAREKVAGFTAQRAETQARLDGLTAQIEHLIKRCATAEEAASAAESDAARAESTLSEASGKRRDVERLGQELEARLEESRQLVTQREEEARAAMAEKAMLLANQSKLQAQLEVLEQAEQMLTGYADGARFLLDPTRQASLGVRGALSSLLELPAELEVAIAAALGDAIDCVLIEGQAVDQALDLLEEGGAGRAALMPLESRHGLRIDKLADAEVIGVASEVVRVPEAMRPVVEALLGGTLLVRTRAAARRLHKTIPENARIVTLRGEVFRGNGLIVAGKAPSTPTLSRPRQIRELAEAVGETTTRLRRLEDRARLASEQLQAATAELSSRESSLDGSRKALMEQQAVEHRAELEVERQRRLLEWHRGRLEELLRDKAEAELERQSLSTMIAEYERDSEAARSTLQLISEELGQLSLDEAQELTAYWSMRSGVTQQAAESARLRKTEHELIQQRLARQEQDLLTRMDEEQAGLAKLDAERAALLEREHGLQQEIAALQEQIGPAEHELESWEGQEAGLAESETEVQRASTSADRILTQHEIDLVRRKEALESLRMRIVDDFGLVSFEYAASVEGPVPLPFEGLVEELRAVTELAPDLEDQLNQRRARLRRLGLINPEAARDYEAESQRHSFLNAQVQDLRQAEADLRQVIAELDELTRQEFSRTYSAVDKQFRTIFTRLFGGGSARLSLTDPDDLIETGIEIEARLPGRREQGLSLLSGGERSLTAIALVFALLKVSPTPVCVLDEVDAMLDEANVGRFRDLLAELSQETQFIIITHNRNTVQAADYIYGVTMGRDSTSQIISLRLDEVSEEMLGTSRV